MSDNAHNIKVVDGGAYCSCGRSRETPDRSDARNWATVHFQAHEKGMLSDDRLNP